jgi:hypothetical protein
VKGKRAGQRLDHSLEDDHARTRQWTKIPLRACIATQSDMNAEDSEGYTVTKVENDAGGQYERSTPCEDCGHTGREHGSHRCAGAGDTCRCPQMLWRGQRWWVPWVPVRGAVAVLPDPRWPVSRG